MRHDNDLLSCVNAWLDVQEEVRSSLRKVEVVLAFALLCILVWAAFHLGPVL